MLFGIIIITIPFSHKCWIILRSLIYILLAISSAILNTWTAAIRANLRKFASGFIYNNLAYSFSFISVCFIGFLPFLFWEAAPWGTITYGITTYGPQTPLAEPQNPLAYQASNFSSLLLHLAKVLPAIPKIFLASSGALCAASKAPFAVLSIFFIMVIIAYRAAARLLLNSILMKIVGHNYAQKRNPHIMFVRA